MIFIDTNYILRFLLNDINEQHNKVKQLFIDASEGKIKLFTSTIVFFEVYWVLSSFYGKNKNDLIEVLLKLLELKFINLRERQIISNSISRFSKVNMSLEDCYNIYYAKSRVAKEFKTFDQQLQKEFLKQT